MYVCMYVCACMYVRMYVCICVYMCMCVPYSHCEVIYLTLSLTTTGVELTSKKKATVWPPDEEDEDDTEDDIEQTLFLHNVRTYVFYMPLLGFESVHMSFPLIIPHSPSSQLTSGMFVYMLAHSMLACVCYCTCTYVRVFSFKLDYYVQLNISNLTPL